MKIIKVFVFVFCLLFTTHALSRSNEYYKQTITHVLTECNSKCQKQIFEQEIEKAFFALFEAVLNQLRFELNEKKKEKLWLKTSS